MEFYWLLVSLMKLDHKKSEQKKSLAWKFGRRA